MFRRISPLILLCALLLAAPRAHAQGIPVYDDANFLANLAQVAQLILGVVEAVTQTAQGVENLLPLADIAVAGDVVEMVGQLTEVAAEGQALMGDAQSARVQFAALFGLENIPTTPDALTVRMQEMRTAIYEAQAYATRVQALAATFTSAMRHVTTIVNLLHGIAGNKQAQQAANQLLALQNQTAATQALQAAADQRVRTMIEAERRVVIASYNYIQCDMWSDWPGFTGCN